MIFFISKPVLSGPLSSNTIDNQHTVWIGNLTVLPECSRHNVMTQRLKIVPSFQLDRD